MPKASRAVAHDSERRKLLLVTVFVLVANLADLLSTYAASPDLAGEWNVLERHLGLGWVGLILAKLIGGALAVAGYAYYLRWRTACYPAPGAGWRRFCRAFAFGRAAPRLPGMMDLATTPNLWVNLGFLWLGMQWLVLWVALDNLLLLNGFSWGIRGYSELGYHLLQSFVVAGVVFARMLSTNYRQYRSLPLHAAVVVVEPEPVPAGRM